MCSLQMSYQNTGWSRISRTIQLCNQVYEGCLTLLEIREIYWNNFSLLEILEIYWILAKSPGNFLADSKFLYFTVYQ